ncbi:hypothetical protein GALMADRAFT_152980 [Galerina marginata CBS 339.88]|uniref:G domain-containing protein n=1 Tax=Galerina marginata (strain CBS 339.88) TaxID=685588 RepID=A0A067TIX0_GALM3|nr:hypothetical protein GALMADRAFT_152980 [Galerina marginata CBS 339.88]
MAEKNDIVILVTGESGSGKSTFVNTLLGRERMKVGHDMSACTTKIEYEATYPTVDCGPLLQDRRLIIVDTPGFNNPDRALTDTAVLLQIADWLERQLSKRITLGGIIYLQDINQDRLSPITQHGQAALRASFGGFEATFGKLVFATTKWNRMQSNPRLGLDQERKFGDILRELTNQDESRLHRFKDNNSSAWEIVEALLDHDVDVSRADIVNRVKMLKEKLPTRNSRKGILDLLVGFFGKLQRKTMAQTLKSVGSVSAHAEADTTRRRRRLDERPQHPGV